MKVEQDKCEIKHALVFHTNGGELRKMLDELEAILKKINDFTLEVYECGLPVHELNQ